LISGPCGPSFVVPLITSEILDSLGNRFYKTLEAGEHQITLTVTDSGYEQVKAFVNITIEKIHSISPTDNTSNGEDGDDNTDGDGNGGGNDNGDSDDDDKETQLVVTGIDFTMTVIGLIIMFLVFIIIIFIISKTRKKEQKQPCPECGVLLSQGVNVCPDCGAEITIEEVTIDEESELDELQRKGDINGDGEKDNDHDNDELKSEIGEVDELFDELEEKSELEFEEVDNNNEKKIPEKLENVSKEIKKLR